MTRACVLLADGFEETEAVTLIDVLRRARVDVVTAGIRARRVTGSHAIPIEADATLADVAHETFDAVVLPGGMPGATHLRDDAGVRALVTAQHAAGRWVAAICAAPIVLGAAGLLRGKRATCYPGFESQLEGATVSTEPVVTDCRIMTSRGVGTALEMSLALVRELVDDASARKLRSAMLVAD